MEELLAESGLAPARLGPKEGLALINGTQATTGLGLLALLAAERALEAAEASGAMSVEALLGTPTAFRSEIQAARPHAGQAVSAARLRALIAGSEIRESHRAGDPRVQDAYSLRCVPQVHGAARSALGYVRGILEVEVNSATDNPLVFPDAERGADDPGTVLSGGKFPRPDRGAGARPDGDRAGGRGVHVRAPHRASHQPRPVRWGSPPFSPGRPGLESGFMAVQVVVADLLSEMRVLAHPASVDSVPTSASQEDHVSMGLAAARKARRSVSCLERILAAELACAAQGIDYRRPLRSGAGVEEAHALVRARVAALEGDRSLTADLEALTGLVRSGAVAEITRTGGDR